MPDVEMAEMTEETTDDMSDAFMPEEATEETASEEVSVDEEEAENPTALLPLTALGKGAKVGDSVTLKVVAVHGDEVEVELSSGGKPSEKKTEETETADAELDRMDTGGY